MHHLTLRGRTYCVRFIIPKDRWFDVGKATGSTTGRRRDIVRTLGTQCRFEALRRRDAAISAICNHLNQVLQEADMKPLGSGWIPQWSSDVSDDEPPLATANKACVQPSSSDAIMTKTPERRASERWQRQEEPECLGALLTRWHRELDGQVTNELLDRHRLSLRYLGEFLLGQETGDPMVHVLSLRLSDVTKREVSGFREWMIQTKGIQPLTAGFRLSCLKSFWDWAADAGLMDAPNPWQGAARGLKRRAEKTLKPNGEKRPFTEAELLALLSADPQTNRNGKWGPAIHDIFRLGLLTGARQNELASLTVGRVIQSERPDVLWGIRVTADVGQEHSGYGDIRFRGSGDCHRIALDMLRENRRWMEVALERRITSSSPVLQIIFMGRPIVVQTCDVGASVLPVLYVRI